MTVEEIRALYNKKQMFTDYMSIERRLHGMLMDANQYVGIFKNPGDDREQFITDEHIVRSCIEFIIQLNEIGHELFKSSVYDPQTKQYVSHTELNCTTILNG